MVGIRAQGQGRPLLRVRISKVPNTFEFFDTFEFFQIKGVRTVPDTFEFFGKEM